jgi:hypothetical protein
MHIMKAFYVIVSLTTWHGHAERHVQTAGWMTEHQCHVKARWMEEQHPHTRAYCERRDRG